MLRFVDMYRQISFICLFFLLAIPLSPPISVRANSLCPNSLIAQQGEDEDDTERVNKLFNEAQDAHEKGDLVKAIALYKETIKLIPDRFEPKYQCATACLASNKPEFINEAVILLKEVIAIKPDFARAYYSLGNAIIRVPDGDLAVAEAALRRAAELDNKLPVRSQLADLLMRRGAYNEAEAELQALIKEGQADFQNNLLLGIVQESSGKKEDAITAYTRAIELKKEEIDGYYRRGKLYKELKNYPAAITDLKQAFQLSKEDLEIGYLLAESYGASGDKKMGLELATTLSAKAPETLKGPFSELLAQLGANDAAITQFEQALAKDTKNVKYMKRLGELYLSIDPVKSAQYWRQVVALERNTDNIVGFASALLKAQQFEESIANFNIALADKPDYYEAHAGLGLALFKLERFALSAEQFIFVTRAHPENPIGFYFLAICFDRLGDYERALAGYQLFLKIASPKLNQLEIDKVNLRLPSLRRQLEKSGKKKR